MRNLIEFKFYYLTFLYVYVLCVFTFSFFFCKHLNYIPMVSPSKLNWYKLTNQLQMISRNNRARTYNIARYLSQVPVELHQFGSMDIICSFCNAKMWIGERLTVCSASSPRFDFCFKSGRFAIPVLKQSHRSIFYC
jgi:hypothetical protein